MYILTESRTVNKIAELIRENSNIFSGFNNVYVFGSVLNEKCVPNDLDILLVYEGDAMRVLHKVSDIRLIFEKNMKLPIDLTILSSKEVVETDFLEKINYVKVK